jgi:hypothetical protein
MHFSYENIKQNFIDAVNDYHYLINKKFPQKAILKLVGDRYKLSSVERSILYRGIFHEQECEKRILKNQEEICNHTLYVDTYNVLYTIGSYLNGNVLFFGNDSLLRDASEIHGKLVRSQILDKALSLVFSYLATIKSTELFFYIDKPISNSGKLKKRIEGLIIENSLRGAARLYQSPDHHLKKVTKASVATSDTVIINKVDAKIFDLSKMVLFHHFNPKIVTLSHILI